MAKARPIKAPIERLQQRYDALVERRKGDQCWGWKGCKSPYGYAGFWLGRQYVMAHRVSYILHQGPITEGAVVLHLCHNRLCTNPFHLEVGTQKRNMETSHVDGRLQRKLPMSDFKEIEKRRANGESLADIARSYGCSKQSVRNLIEQHGLNDALGRKRDPDTTITYKGETLPLREWAERLGMDRHTLRWRYVRQGWSAERSLTEPIIRGDPKKRKPFKP